MGTIFNARDRAELLDRIAHLSPEKRPDWGRFTAPEMVCHLNCALRHGLGEYDAGPPVGPFRFPPLNWLVIHVAPWPKGKGKSPPEFLAVTPASWTEDVAALCSLVERSGERGAEATWPPHKVFGHISGRSWGVLQHKHLDHHLRQFGV